MRSVEVLCALEDLARSVASETGEEIAIYGLQRIKAATPNTRVEHVGRLSVLVPHLRGWETTWWTSLCSTRPQKGW